MLNGKSGIKMSGRAQATRGSTTSGLLFLIFLVLKLSGNISWSWWWVASPLWLPIPIVLVAFAFFMLVFVVGAAALDWINSKLSQGK